MANRSLLLSLYLLPRRLVNFLLALSVDWPLFDVNDSKLSKAEMVWIVVEVKNTKEKYPMTAKLIRVANFTVAHHAKRNVTI